MFGPVSSSIGAPSLNASCSSPKEEEEEEAVGTLPRIVSFGMKSPPSKVSCTHGWRAARSSMNGVTPAPEQLHHVSGTASEDVSEEEGVRAYRLSGGRTSAEPWHCASR